MGGISECSGIELEEHREQLRKIPRRQRTEQELIDLFGVDYILQIHTNRINVYREDLPFPGEVASLDYVNREVVWYDSHSSKLAGDVVHILEREVGEEINFRTEYAFRNNATIIKKVSDFV